MNCPKCQTQNEEGAQFCINCGTKMQYLPESANDRRTADLLIMIFLIYAAVSLTARQIILNLVDNWHEGYTQYIIAGIAIISGVSFIFLSIAIDNKTKKIFGIILASIYAIIIIYSNIRWLVH